MCAQCFWGIEAGALALASLRATVVSRGWHRSLHRRSLEPGHPGHAGPVGDDAGQAEARLLGVAVAALAPGVDTETGVAGLADEPGIDGVSVGRHGTGAPPGGVAEQLIPVRLGEGVAEEGDVVAHGRPREEDDRRLVL